MRYFGSFESYALFLYKSKTSVTQIVPPQPNHIYIKLISYVQFSHPNLL